MASVTSPAARAPTKSVMAAAQSWSAVSAMRCPAVQPFLWGVVSGDTAILNHLNSYVDGNSCTGGRYLMSVEAPEGGLLYDAGVF